MVISSRTHTGGTTIKAHFETGAQPQPHDELTAVYTAKEITLRLARWAAAGEIGSAQLSQEAYTYSTEGATCDVPPGARELHISKPYDESTRDFTASRAHTEASPMGSSRKEREYISQPRSPRLKHRRCATQCPQKEA